MRQVCPTCNGAVGNDNICQVCGPVVPIVVEFDAAQAVAQRQAGQQVTAGAQAGGGGGNALVGMVFLVGILAGSWYAANLIFNPDSLPNQVKRTDVDNVLAPMATAFQKGDLATAKQRVDQLAKIADPGSRVVGSLRTVLAVLNTESPDGPTLRGAFSAIEWLRARQSFALLDEVGKQCKHQLEKKVQGLIERARALADEGRYAQALDVYESIPRSSEYHEQLVKEIAGIGNKASQQMGSQAKKTFAEGNLPEAESLATRAQKNAVGELRTEMRKLVKEIQRARARKARELYRAGKIKEAGEMLGAQRTDDKFRGFVKQMKEVAALADRAQQMEAAGNATEARAAWEKIIKVEKDPANHFVKLAREALSK